MNTETEFSLAMKPLTGARVWLTVAFAAVALCGCTTAQPVDRLESAKSFEFTDCKRYAEHIALSLDDESRAIVKSTEYGDLIQFHHGWGTGIRNEGGLWAGNDALNLSCASLRGENEVIHPDSVSMIIIQEVWELLQGTDDT